MILELSWRSCVSVDRLLSLPFRGQTIAWALNQIPRTGWLQRGVADPETDYQHTLAMIQLADSLASRWPELRHDELRLLLAVHEWPEIIDGDVVTATLPTAERAQAEAAKHESELAAMRQICSELADGMGLGVMDLWQEYEAGETPEAAVARQIDKLQTMQQAWAYEQAGEAVSAQEFIESHRQIIVHPVLTAELARLERAIATAT